MLRKLLILVISLALFAVLAMMTTIVLGVSSYFAATEINTEALTDQPSHFEQTKTHRHDLPAKANLVITNPLGNLTLTGAETESIKLTAIVTAKSPAKELLDELENSQIQIIETENALEISSILPNSGGTIQVSVDYFLTVPQEINVDATASLGTLRIDSINGEFKLRNLLGDIHGHDIQGDGTIQSDMGDIILTNALFGESLDLRALVGNVTLTGTPGLQTSITTGRGDVQLFLPIDSSYQLTAGYPLGQTSLGVPFEGEEGSSSANGVIGEGDPMGSISIMLNTGDLQIQYQ